MVGLLGLEVRNMLWKWQHNKEMGWEAQVMPNADILFLKMLKVTLLYSGLAKLWEGLELKQLKHKKVVGENLNILTKIWKQKQQ